MGWGLEHRASNPVSVKNLTAIENSTIVKLLRLYVPVGTKRTRRRRRRSRDEGWCRMANTLWLLYSSEFTNCWLAWLVFPAGAGFFLFIAT
jgi:hypothetical protein